MASMRLSWHMSAQLNSLHQSLFIVPPAAPVANGAGGTEGGQKVAGAAVK